MLKKPDVDLTVINRVRGFEEEELAPSFPSLDNDSGEEEDDEGVEEDKDTLDFNCV